MQLSSFVFAALTLAVVPLAAPQERPGRKPDAPRPTGSAEAAEKLRGALLGTWELQSLQLQGTSYAGRQCAGYLLVLPGYLSMHTRMLMPEASDPTQTAPAFSSGTHRWTYDEGRLVLQLSSLLAINDMNANADVEYEPPGVQREYTVDVVDDQLTLSRGSEVRMDFRRVGRAVPTEPSRKAEPRK